ncbi:MAG: M3 family metallopeptidase, partial [Bacteroidia bacterium]
MNIEEILANNPLIKPWKGDFGGLPPFDSVKIADFEPAMRAAMQIKLKEVDAIADSKEEASFKNTIEAMELTGAEFDRVLTIYGIWSSSMSTKEFQEVENVMEPELAGFSDKIVQNSNLFKRIEKIRNSSEFGSLTSEQQRLTDDYYKMFIRSGAKLDDAAKKRLTEINAELAGLFTKFSQNLLSDENDLIVELSSKDDLKGLPQSLVDASANAAKSKGLEGKWIINNTRSSVDPFLTYSERRDLREKVWNMFVNRGDNGGEHDNNKLITEILKLRAERAKVLGFESHAHWRLQNTMAKTPKKAIELMESVWTPAVERVKEEVKDMQDLANKQGDKITIEPWDYRYYAEKVRKAKYDLDQNEVKPYLQLEKLREGMFWVAGELFGFEFSALTGIPVYHTDVRVWEVKDKASGKHIGLWYFDAYAREGKRSGAWMNNYRDQYRIKDEVTTIVSNNSNFVKGNPGESVLISWDDASTLF